MRSRTKIAILIGIISASLVVALTFNADRNQQKVTIGAVIPLTGPGSFVGELINRGLQIAFEEAPPNFQLNPQDSASNPTKGLSAYRHLRDTASSQVNIVALSSVINSVLPSVIEDKTLMIGTATVLPDLPKKGPNIIRYFPSANQLAGQLAEYAAANHKRIAVLYVEDEYGKQSEAVFTEKLRASHATPIFKGSFPLAPTESRDLALKVAATNPDVIFIPGYGPNYLPIIAAIKTALPKTIILADIQLTVPEYIKAAGSVAEGVVLLASRLDCGLAETDGQKHFMMSYEAKFGIRPGLHAFIAYDLAKIIITAETGKAQQEIPNSVAKNFLNQSPVGTLVPVRIDSDGDASFELIVCRIEGGKLKPHHAQRD